MIFLQVAVMIAEYPYFAIIEELALITQSNTIPPIIPPGPSNASVDVIAAAPTNPIVLITVKKTIGAVQKEMGSPNYFKFTREFKSAKI